MGPQRRILVVDDEAVIVNTIRSFLEHRSWDVTTVGDGRRALEMLKLNHFDAILLDLRLPVLSGIDVLKALQVEPKRDRIIVMTAFGESTSILEAMRLGAIDIIHKPFTPEELWKVIETALEYPIDPVQLENRFSSTLDESRRHLREQRIPLALQEAARALAINPKRPEAYHLLGVCHDMLGSTSEASQMYRLALDIDPDFSPSQKNLHRLMFEGGRRGEVVLE